LDILSPFCLAKSGPDRACGVSGTEETSTKFPQQYQSR
jgi:hypothetical protein